jgi:rhodanese-related sulfurtransferase
MGVEHVSRIVWASFVFGLLLANPAVPQQISAQPVAFTFNGQDLSVTRKFGATQTKAERFAVVQEDCTKLCLSPFKAAPDVETIGEAEVTDFLVNVIQSGNGLLLDARLPDARMQGHLATSVNVPHQAVEEGNPYRNQILSALGAREFDGILNFSDAMELIVFDAGPTDSRAVKLINNLLTAGYPPEKLRFYRGGMQVWASLGLNYVEQTQ